MAKNLRAKIPSRDELIVCDANPTTMDQFRAEHADIHTVIARSPREVAEKSVSISCTSLAFLMSHCSIDDLSWGLPSGFPSSDFTQIKANPLN